jgi:AcrR family transcriptional regulator
LKKKNYHHGNLRVALIEAGIKIINKEGLNRLSLRKVAALCNVSHSAPYSHFKDKVGLLEAMQGYVAKQFESIFESIIQSSDSPDSPDLLNKIGEFAYNGWLND